MIIRQRAGKRLMKIKAWFKAHNIKTREDCKRMVVEDWKMSQNVFLDEENDVDFKFKLNPNNIQYPRMPVEASLSSFKEKVEALQVEGMPEEMVQPEIATH